MQARHGTPAKPLRPKCRHGDRCHAVVARIGGAPLSNHDRQKRRCGILGGRIGEHFPLQRLEVSRPVVCMSPSSRSGLAPATPPQATGHRSSAWGARERGPSSARTGVPSLVQARPKAQCLQANRPCSTSGRRHPAKLRHSQCSFYAVFIVGFTLGILGVALTQPPDHRIARILGRTFRSKLQPETSVPFWS